MSEPDLNDIVDIMWKECWDCGGTGLNGHDCGEDTCCCAYPEENMPCQICDGQGGWKEFE